MSGTKARRPPVMALFGLAFFLATLALPLASPTAGAVPSGAFTFVAVGDMGTTATSRANVARMAAANPAFVLHAGDVAYSGGSASVWDAFMRQVQPLTSKAAYYPAIGNHDYEGGLSLYLSHLHPPGNGRWYSVNYSSAHVISLDGGPSWTSNTIPAGETAWLERDLAANAQDPAHPWTVVLFHYPAFSTGSHGGWVAGRRAWSPLFDRYGVDLVINGHDHDYERSWPVWSNGTVQQASYISPAAPVYVVTGGGGESLYQVSGKAPWSAFHTSTYESLRITIDGDTLVEQAVRPDGSILDSFTLVKGTKVATTTASTPSTPVVSLQATPLASESLTADFTATVSGGIGPYTITWDFGDRTAGMGASANHTYGQPGVYTVRVVVQDAQGRATSNSLLLTLPATAQVLPTVAGGTPWQVPLVAAGLAGLVGLLVAWYRRRRAR